MEAGEILLNRGLLDEAGLKTTRDAQINGNNLMHTAVQLGLVDEEQALRVIGEEIGLQYVDLAEFELDLSLLKAFPQRLIHRETLFPLRQQNDYLLVATCDPFHLYPLDEISAMTGWSVEPVLASRAEITKLIKTHLGVGSETVDGLLEQSDIELVDAIEHDDSELSQMAQEASVVRLVNEILLEAIESRASDVHIESHESGLTIRYRIDGMLQAQPAPPEINHFHAAIISRLKIMARLNIAEKRLPQDGRIKLKVSAREIDVRVSVIPMIHGEGIVMRVLDKGAMAFELQSLGMPEAIYTKFRELIQLPHGIILVTGPTGSGKTTTLYSSLLEIRNVSTKIITTEDPVEYQLEGINQIQVQPKIGLTFSSSLRSILRHDPDVVLVGEIRDLETAENAIQASLTGHLVFSTLHTNDAASAFARLIDMGAESFLVASTIEAVMAQRLVRTLCPHCKEEFRPMAADLPTDFPLEQLNQQDGKLFRSSGCRQCRQLGYLGRTGIYELLIVNDHIRQLAHDRTNSWDILNAAVQNGLNTLRHDGWDKVLRGVSSVDEILRVTKGNNHFA